MDKHFISLIQTRVGNSAIGPSTARGMGPEGTIQAAKEFFQQFDIRAIKSRSKKSFHENLNKATDELMQSLPQGGRYWGSSRKFINIFIRDCLYNRYLNEHYGLDKLEPWLEIPLDSHVGKGLRLELEGSKLPRWKTVVGLSPDISELFQEVAISVASRKNISRIHLDILYWRGAHMINKQA